MLSRTLLCEELLFGYFAWSSISKDDQRSLKFPLPVRREPASG